MWKRLIAVFPFIKRKSSQKASKHKQVQAYRLLPLNKTRNVPFQTRRIQVVTFNVGSSLLSSIYWPMHQGVVATDYISKM